MKKKTVKKMKINLKQELPKKEIDERVIQLNARADVKIENLKKKQKIPYKFSKEAIREGILSFTIALAVGIFVLFSTKKISVFLITAIFLFFALEVYFSMKKKLIISAKIRKLESVFPDFIELMSSNLRAGMTVDRALLTSSRKEFAPLDDEILVLGKDILTGKEITKALMDLATRINSQKIIKTVSVIISGIKSGGDLAILLEETATNMRERDYVEKRAASNVLMYIIFIFFAVAVGAPALFALSSILVEVLTSILSGLPTLDASINVPITLTSISISLTFVQYFSVIFFITIDVLASLLLGLVNKGEEKEGTKYILPLVVISITVYFTIRTVLHGYFADLLA